MTETQERAPLRFGTLRALVQCMGVHSEKQDKKSLRECKVHPRGRRWREPRYALAIAIEVSGIDSTGKPYREETKTVDVSEWGCKFTLHRKLERNDLILLRTLGTQQYCNSNVGATVFMVSRCREDQSAWLIGASKIHAQQIWDLSHLRAAELAGTAPGQPDGTAAQYMLVDTMNDAELDALPYGAFQLNTSGVVVKYNKVGAEFADCEEGDMIGRNLLSEAALWAAEPEFQNSFQKAAGQKEPHQTFRIGYAASGERRSMAVTMLYSERTRTIWIFVQPVERR